MDEKVTIHTYTKCKIKNKTIRMAKVECTFVVVNLLLGKIGTKIFSLLQRSCSKNNSWSGPILISSL